MCVAILLINKYHSENVYNLAKVLVSTCILFDIFIRCQTLIFDFSFEEYATCFVTQTRYALRKVVSSAAFNKE